MKYFAYILFFGILFTACGDDDEDTLLDKQRRLGELQTNIENLIADKSCNGAGDCASMAFGDKPCGGPRSYLIYAPSNVDVAQLTTLVEEYNMLDEEINILTQALSDCAIVGPPILGCTDDVCAAL